jgi:RNA polymerase sigma factor (sigma-70 family)
MTSAGDRLTTAGEGDDAALVRATLQGDTAAYARLFDRHARAVRTTARGQVRDADAVDDAVQETFARALDRLEQLRDPTRFRPWLLSIARNAATDARRRLTRIDQEPLAETGEEDGIVVAAEDLGPEDLAAVRARAELVRGAVAGLSARDATALSMVLWLGFGPTDVAASLGIKAGAAKVLLHRARLRLRDALLVELLAAARSGDCTEVARLVEEDDEVAAARHVRSCAICGAAGRRLLDLPTGSDPS